MQADNSTDSWQEIELEIQELTEALAAINQKFKEAKVMDSDRTDLQAQKQELQKQLKTQLKLIQRQELKTELQTVQTKLEDIDAAIAAQLITWSSFKEPFWQIVRYTGLGFLLGVLVKGWVS
jgi:methylase of polypeptide subunit release factors